MIINMAKELILWAQAGDKYVGEFKNDKRNGQRNLYMGRWRQIRRGI